jgi:type I restriction enzyme S subunit
MKLNSGYKQTELGVIPEDWNVRNMNSVASITRLAGAEYSSVWKETPNGEIIALRGFNIGENRIIERDIVRISNKLSLSLPRSRLRKGDVVYPCVGTIGNAVVIEEDNKFHIQQNIARLMPRNELFPHYLAYYLMSPLGAGEVLRFNATSSQPNVLVGSLRQYRIPLPATIDEQRAIAAILSDVDALINALDQLIAKKRAIKQGVMQELLTGKKRLPGFHGEWEVKPLGDVGVFSKGRGIKKNEVVADGLPCVRYGEIYTRHDDYLKAFNSFITPAIAKQSQRIEKGDLLFTGSGETAEEIGKCVAFLGDEEAYAGGDIVIFRPIGQDSKFLGYLMNHSSVASQKARMGQGDAVVHISARNLGQLRSCLPPLEEQTAIATVLSDMDAELAALEQKRDKTRALKQGMMQELLTGKMRLV